MKKYQGPYTVKNIGVNGGVYEVVFMLEETTNTYEELRPRKTYLNRQSAYRRCAVLNKRHAEDHAFDEFNTDAYTEFDEIDY